MSAPKVKATYALDPGSIRALERMARRLNVSRSEALRRAIRSAAEDVGLRRSDAVAALDRLQRCAALTQGEARRLARSLRTERRAASSRRESRRD